MATGYNIKADQLDSFVTEGISDLSTKTMDLNDVFWIDEEFSLTHEYAPADCVLDYDNKFVPSKKLIKAASGYGDAWNIVDTYGFFLVGSNSTDKPVYNASVPKIIVANAIISTPDHSNSVNYLYRVTGSNESNRGIIHRYYKDSYWHNDIIASAHSTTGIVPTAIAAWIQAGGGGGAGGGGTSGGGHGGGGGGGGACAVFIFNFTEDTSYFRIDISNYSGAGAGGSGGQYNGGTNGTAGADIVVYYKSKNNSSDTKIMTIKGGEGGYGGQNKPSSSSPQGSGGNGGSIQWHAYNDQHVKCLYSTSGANGGTTGNSGSDLNISASDVAFTQYTAYKPIGWLNIAGFYRMSWKGGSTGNGGGGGASSHGNGANGGSEGNAGGSADTSSGTGYGIGGGGGGRKGGGGCSGGTGGPPLVWFFIPY